MWCLLYLCFVRHRRIECLFSSNCKFSFLFWQLITAHLMGFLQQILFIWLLSKAKSYRVISFCFNKTLITVEIHIWKDSVLLQCSSAAKYCQLVLWIRNVLLQAISSFWIFVVIPVLAFGGSSKTKALTFRGTSLGTSILCEYSLCGVIPNMWFLVWCPLLCLGGFPTVMVEVPACKVRSALVGKERSSWGHVALEVTTGRLVRVFVSNREFRCQ